MTQRAMLRGLGRLAAFVAVANAVQMFMPGSGGSTALNGNGLLTQQPQFGTGYPGAPGMPVQTQQTMPMYMGGATNTQWPQGQLPTTAAQMLQRPTWPTQFQTPQHQFQPNVQGHFMNTQAAITQQPATQVPSSTQSTGLGNGSVHAAGPQTELEGPRRGVGFKAIGPKPDQQVQAQQTLTTQEVVQREGQRANLNWRLLFKFVAQNFLYKHHPSFDASHPRVDSSRLAFFPMPRPNMEYVESFGNSVAHQSPIHHLYKELEAAADAYCGSSAFMYLYGPSARKIVEHFSLPSGGVCRRQFNFQVDAAPVAGCKRIQNPTECNQTPGCLWENMMRNPPVKLRIVCGAVHATGIVQNPKRDQQSWTNFYTALAKQWKGIHIQKDDAERVLVGSQLAGSPTGHGFQFHISMQDSVSPNKPYAMPSTVDLCFYDWKNQMFADVSGSALQAITDYTHDLHSTHQHILNAFFPRTETIQMKRHEIDHADRMHHAMTSVTRVENAQTIFIQQFERFAAAAEAVFPGARAMFGAAVTRNLIYLEWPYAGMAPDITVQVICPECTVDQKKFADFVDAFFRTANHGLSRGPLRVYKTEYMQPYVQTMIMFPFLVKNSGVVGSNGSLIGGRRHDQFQVKVETLTTRVRFEFISTRNVRPSSLQPQDHDLLMIDIGDKTVLDPCDVMGRLAQVASQPNRIAPIKEWLLTDSQSWQMLQQGIAKKSEPHWQKVLVLWKVLQMNRDWLFLDPYAKYDFHGRLFEGTRLMQRLHDATGGHFQLQNLYRDIMLRVKANYDKFRTDGNLELTTHDQNAALLYIDDQAACTRFLAEFTQVRPLAEEQKKDSMEDWLDGLSGKPSQHHHAPLPAVIQMTMRVRFHKNYYHQKPEGASSFADVIHAEMKKVAESLQKNLNLTPNQVDFNPSRSLYSQSWQKNIAKAEVEVEANKFAVSVVIKPSEEWIQANVALIGQPNIQHGFKRFGGWTQMEKPPVIKVRLMDFDVKQELPPADMVKPSLIVDVTNFDPANGQPMQLIDLQQHYMTRQLMTSKHVFHDGVSGVGEEETIRQVHRMFLNRASRAYCLPIVGGAQSQDQCKMLMGEAFVCDAVFKQELSGMNMLGQCVNIDNASKLIVNEQKHDFEEMFKQFSQQQLRNGVVPATQSAWNTCQYLPNAQNPPVTTVNPTGSTFQNTQFNTNSNNTPMTNNNTPLTNSNNAPIPPTTRRSV